MDRETVQEETVREGTVQEETLQKEPGREKKSGGFGKGFLAGLLAAALLLAGAFGIGYALERSGGDYTGGLVSEKDVQGKLDRINRVISEYYLYEDEIDTESLVDGIYAGYTASLGDPYTAYYGEEETEELMESLSGEFGGIGATISKHADGDEIKLVEILEGSPAGKAGLQAGDVLLSVDGHQTTGQDLDTVVSWTSGEPGTEVVIRVQRNGEEIEATVVRDIIETQTVDHEMKEGRIGYIRVTEFDQVTYEQFKEALSDLEEQSMESLIIDLRGNPGGRLDTVTDMLKLLLPEGTIVSTKDKYGNTDEITCDGSREFTKPLAVLVDGRSASASEIFSAAVQDYGTGVIVGTQTYGKGVVQQTVDLGDGTLLKITIAEYYTPSGRSINGTGVTPDVEVEYVYDENDPGRDNQLEAAIEAVNPAGNN